MPFFVFQIWWQCSKASWDSADQCFLSSSWPQKNTCRGGIMFFLRQQQATYFFRICLLILSVSLTTAPQVPTNQPKHQLTMALSSGPLGGLAGGLHPFQNHCSLRDVESSATRLTSLMMNIWLVLNERVVEKLWAKGEVKRKLVESSKGLFFQWQDGWTF